MMKFPKLISASAGSGKTYTITQEIFKRLSNEKNPIQPNEIIATTFTKKAANELKNRIREKLIENGLVEKANMMNEALVGTVHSIGLRIIEKYAFDLGLSPMLQSLDQNDQKVVMRECLHDVLDEEFFGLARRVYQTEENVYNAEVPPYISHIEEIISAARSNNMRKEDFSSYAKYSIEEYWKIFDHYIDPESGNEVNPSMEKYEDQKKNLLKKVKAELAAIKPNLAKLAKKPKSAYFKLKRNAKHLENDTLDWQQWVKLVDVAPEVVNRLPYNSKYREDWNAYIESCFRYAAEAIDAYENYKEQNALLDFPDQEAEFYRLLNENETLSKKIANKYKLLVVDEFQDTSPLQLALFFKLTQRVEESIWVGDPKQSIYAFRGTDPALMKAVSSSAKKNGEKEFDILKESYRSRPDLVKFSNHIFEKAFKNSLSKEEVHLNVASSKATNRVLDKEKEMGPAIHYWNVKSANGKKMNQTMEHESLALRIEQLINEEKPIIFDKAKKIYREAQFGDVAVLCRSNLRCQSLSSALLKTGVPVATSGPGLAEEPEIIFLLALLKNLVYPFDTLAKAEILLYSDYKGQRNELLNDRMQNLLDNKAYEWGDDNEYLMKLKGFKKSIYRLSISRIIEQMISQLHLGKLFASWGNINQRLANVEAFLKQAIEYENTANRLKVASSIPGFINWFDGLAKTREDLKGEQTSNAVQIMTYHTSKGLEWPIVLLFQLDFDLKDSFYGVNVIPAEEVSFEAPLQDRKIRFWIKPYHSSTPHGRIDTLINASAEKNHAEEKALEEEKRLNYVAMTRARDYLYFCMREDNINICKMINPDLEVSKEAYVKDEFFITTEEGNVQIFAEEILSQRENDFSNFDTTSQRNFFPDPIDKEDVALYKLAPSSIEKDEDARVGDAIDSSDKVFFKRGKSKDSEIGNFVHAIIAAFDSSLSEKECKEMIAGMQRTFGFQELVSVDQLYDGLLSFYNYLEKSLGEAKIYKELPIQYFYEGQYLSGYVDMLCETAEGLYIIDHKTYVNLQGEKSAYKEKAMDFIPQLKAYQEVLEKSFSKPVFGTYINYFLAGIMMSIEIPIRATNV